LIFALVLSTSLTFHFDAYILFQQLPLSAIASAEWNWRFLR